MTDDESDEPGFDMALERFREDSERAADLLSRADVDPDAAAHLETVATMATAMYEEMLEADEVAAEEEIGKPEHAWLRERLFGPPVEAAADCGEDAVVIDFPGRATAETEPPRSA